jgi:hypothetical protein
MIIEMVMKIDLDFTVIKQTINNDYLIYNIKYPKVMSFINNTNPQSLPNIHLSYESLFFKSKLKECRFDVATTLCHKQVIGDKLYN